MIFETGIYLRGLLTPSRLAICDPPTMILDTTTALEGPDAPYRIYIVILVLFS